ncbi:MAG: carboxypeptidase-like regulatory domain-containing protein [Methanobacterium sp.]
MKKLFFVILLLSLELPVFAQSAITGKIFNSDTKEKVPYVSIGIEGKTTGTVSNDAGEFSLKISENISLSDSITVSSIGFKTVKFALADLSEVGNEINLVPVIYELVGAVVTNRTTKNVILGRNQEGSGMLECPFFISYEMNSQDRISREIGMLFTTKNDCKVNSVNFFIKRNNYANVKFRLTFYSVENDQPKDIIINQNIIFDIKDQYKGWFKLELEPFLIFIQKRESFVVTLMLLEDELNNQRNWFSFPGALISGYNVFRRDKAMDKWTKKKYAVSMFLETTAFID